MTIYTLRSGGTAHPETSVLQLSEDLTNSTGVVDLSGGDFEITEKGTPDLSVDVGIGRAYVQRSASNTYPVRNTAVVNEAVTANATGNPRIDTIVLYIDLSASPDAEATNVAKLEIVEGTPAPAPVPPSNAEIATAIGSANPFMKLADIDVSSGATSIVNADITDLRIQWTTTGAGGGSGSFIYGELVNETPDGIVTIFSVDNPYVPVSSQVYVDGQLQQRGASNDYVETNPGSGQITFNTAPVGGSVILVSYQFAVSTFGNADTVDGYHAIEFSRNPEDWITNADAASINMDLDNGKKHRQTITASRTLTLSNVGDGVAFIVAVIQDGTGGWGITWFAGIDWPDATEPTLSADPNAVDVFGFIQTGTNTYYGFIVGQNLS